MIVRSKSLLLPSLSSAVLSFTIATLLAQSPPTAGRRQTSTVGSQGPMPVHAKFSTEQVDAGNALFLQNCAFCHGKEAGGGESGPDLTRSNLVSGDKNGEAIGAIIRSGKPAKGMPGFSLDEAQIANLVAFIHAKQDVALSQTGNRKGVDEADLQTGDAAAGKRYFEGAGGCTQCHSATGDLAGIATRFKGLRLEMQMLYPREAVQKITVKTPTGETINGTLEYQDEFTIGMKDASGTYHSWPAKAVTFKLDDSLQAHLKALEKYTDDDIHNVLAYVQTLK